MNVAILKPDKIIMVLVGILVISVVIPVITITTLLGVIPLWGLFLIPFLIFLFLYVILMIDNGYIKLMKDAIEIKNGTETAQLIYLNNIKFIKREYKDVSKYSVESSGTITERLLVFYLKDNRIIKVNDSIYSKKDRNILYSYLKTNKLNLLF